MKARFLFLLFVCTIGYTHGQEGREVETPTFVTSGINFIKDDWRFSKEPIGLMKNRLDSIFQSPMPLNFCNYTFKSYDGSGRFVGRGSFHLHAPEGKGHYNCNQSDSLILNHPNGLVICVLSLKANDLFGNLNSSWSATCHYNWLTVKKMKSGMLWGSQSGMLFSNDDIRRMPGR